MRLTAVLLLSLLLFFSPALLTAQEKATSAPDTAAADSHAELADALVNLLQRTAATLETCTDAAAVSTALPQLKEQREEAARLIARQAALPEPTVQDYMAAQVRANDFLDAKRAIRTHIERLQREGLLSPELREILGIAPETAAAQD